MVTVLCGVSIAAIVEVHPGMSIQQAVDSSSNGDTVLIFEGDYAGTVVLYGKTLTIGSEFLLDGDPFHIEGTIVTPDSARQDTHSCFVYAYGEQVGGRLVGLLLSGGTGTLWNESGTPAGGVVHICSSAVAIENCVIENGISPYGGGIGLLRRQIHQPVSSLQLASCTIRNCTCSNWGGGLYAVTSAASLMNCTFQNNASGIGGGGIDFIAECSVIVESCSFHNNWGVTGGAVLGHNQGSIRDCYFEENGGIDLPGLIVSHMRAGGTGLVITNNLFRDNIGGHLAVLLGQFGTPGTSRFFGNVFEGNVATEITGTLGLIQCTGDIAYNVFRNNFNIGGGAIYSVDFGTPHIHHNWFEGNVSDSDSGGSVLVCANRSIPQVDSNAFVGNFGQTITRWHEPSWHPTIHAENNWWGHPSGPHDPVRNPTGQGDTLIEDSVLFIPWLTEPPDTTMPNAVEDDERPSIPRTWELMEIYPNPFNATVQIVLAGFTNSDFEITLHNLLGQQVDVIHVGAMAGGHISYTAPFTLSSGVYFLKASDRNSIQSKKIILMK